MTILLHRQAITFTHPGKWNKQTQRYEGAPGEKVRVAPSARVQEVPDWVGTTEGFKQAEKDGFVVRIKRLSPAAAQAKPVEANSMSALGFGAPTIEPVNIGKNKPMPEPVPETVEMETETAEDSADASGSRPKRRGRVQDPVAAE